ncbi:MAG: hypothetical protein KGV59_07735 [Tenacibaculum sp.]|nr:hypothetical protein [Tenacibaculum sp.]
MKIIVNDRDLTEVVGRITWSGDIRNVARKLEFTIGIKDSDYFYSKLDITIEEGFIVTLKDDDENVMFRGVIIDIKKSVSGALITYSAFDFMFYINNSDISKVFDDTAESIVEKIASELGAKTGEIAETGINVYMTCLPEKAYNAIMMAYSYVSSKNGKKYIPLMDDDKLTIKELGTDSGVMLDGDYNIIDVNYTLTLTKLINKVLVIDKTGAVIETIKDDESIKKYGTVQRVCKEDKFKAKAMLKNTERTTSVSILGDIRALSGYSLLFKEPMSGLVGKFYIESDTHTFENGMHKMDLKLNLENVMDIKEIKK